jgi:hypothetical protein
MMRAALARQDGSVSIVAPDDEREPTALALGRRLSNVIDERPQGLQPLDAEVSNLTEDTAGAVRWYGRAHDGWRADLGILAQLETAGEKCEATSLLAPPLKAPCFATGFASSCPQRVAHTLQRPEPRGAPLPRKMCLHVGWLTSSYDWNR